MLACAARSYADEAGGGPLAPREGEQGTLADHRRVVVDKQEAGYARARCDASDAGKRGEPTHDPADVAANRRASEVQKHFCMAIFHWVILCRESLWGVSDRTGSRGPTGASATACRGPHATPRRAHRRSRPPASRLPRSGKGACP